MSPQTFIQRNLLAKEGSWAERAACHGSKDFTSDDPIIADRAKRVCRTQCPVRQDCLQHALDHHEPYGVWGGLDPYERLTIRPGMYTPERKRARPQNLQPGERSPEGRLIKQCLHCGNRFQVTAPNAQLCSKACQLARKRMREQSYALTAEPRLCPVCHRTVQARYDKIPWHLDSTGKTMCPGAGEPFEITLPDPTAGAVS